ncbi:polysaccharide biosynthesis/export family protein [Roseisalinus antarcticus]|uniref:Polysaccharide biosynthesis/export protein n=1 Tax=Roseisalinus antarcticus TaxID=254357 RepID=A0A1Y5TPZ7_9RHOB|nr:polysaccharide biosynthesis/export family protein [Roseisalinus antarcticus]SLN69269.1 Polysaccharide biosynthesis/export protein [Roseisalinus antarcticus]
MNVRIVLLMWLVGALGACSTLPRGAGLQREVLSVSADVRSGAELPEFAVEQVTRDTVALFASWPSVGEERMAWIERVDQPNNRIISPGDRVSVTIWSTEDNGLLTTAGQRFVTLPDMQISPGGTVFLPYIGTTRIAGMSPETARERIEEKYLVVTPSAQVQLTMTEGRANTVSLVSGVATPGTYPLPDRDFTVMGLIAEGGGVLQSFNNPQIRLQRGSSIYGTSVERLLGTPRLDTTLQGGDKVFVEEDDRYFLSLGAAGSESLHTFAQDHLTALDALSIIGGVEEDRADAQGILILRRYPAETIRSDRSGPNHERTVFTVDLTSADGLFSAGQFLIRPNDLVYVTESPLTSARTIASLMGASLSVLNTASNLARR